MIDQFQSFVTGITECCKYIRRIKYAEMTEPGLKGTHHEFYEKQEMGKCPSPAFWSR